MLLFDLDNFKAVNDTLGHAAGDAVIQRVGRALSGRLRTSDVSARLGGDEFGVILRRVRAEEADRVAAELLDQVQGAIESEADGAGVSLSLGVAPFEGAGHEPDELLRAADAAMYQAKSRGGGGSPAPLARVDARSAPRGSPWRRPRARARCAGRSPAARRSSAWAKSQRGAQPSSRARARVVVDALDARRTCASRARA